MKKSDLLKSLGEIDDKFIESAENKTENKKNKERSFYLKLIPAACAALAVVCVAVPMAAKSNKAKSDMNTETLEDGQSICSNDSGAIAPVAPPISSEQVSTDAVSTFNEITEASGTDVLESTGTGTYVEPIPPVTVPVAPDTDYTPNAYFGGYVYDEVKELLGDGGATLQMCIESEYVTNIENSAYSTYKSGRVVSFDKVAEKIGETVVNCATVHYIDGTRTDVAELRAEIYAIKNVSKEFAVCLKFLDSGEYLTTSHYYSYVNCAMSPETVDEFWIACGITYMKVEGYSLKEGMGDLATVTSYNRHEVLASNIKTMLLDCDGKRVAAVSILEKICEKDSLRAEIRISTYTESNITVTVYNSGYLTCRVADSVYVFEIKKGMSSYIIDSIRQMGNKTSDDDITVVTSN